MRTLKEFIEYCESKGCKLEPDLFKAEIHSPSGVRRFRRLLFDPNMEGYVMVPPLDDEEPMQDEMERNLLRRLRLAD